MTIFPFPMMVHSCCYNPPRHCCHGHQSAEFGLAENHPWMLLSTGRVGGSQASKGGEHSRVVLCRRNNCYKSTRLAVPPFLFVTEEDVPLSETQSRGLKGSGRWSIGGAIVRLWLSPTLKVGVLNRLFYKTTKDVNCAIAVVLVLPML